MPWLKWTRDAAEAAERRLFELVGFQITGDKAQMASASFASPPEKSTLALSIHDTHLGPTPEHYMHHLSCGDVSNDRIVILSGYGAGSGFYFKNLQALSQHFHVSLVDWLGTGLSGRPPFEATSLEQAESFFVDSLHAWVQKQPSSSTPFILVGHSLGGYLAATYAARYPTHVRALVLVGPAGIAAPEPDWEDKLLKKKWSGRGILFRMVKACWQSGVTPGGIVRFVGPLGPKVVHKYTFNRFRSAGLEVNETECFRDYIYGILAAPGSGEHALKHILGPFAWAHKPWEHRLDSVQAPVHFIYGISDWMMYDAGVRACRRVLETRAPRNATDLKAYTVCRSGHFPFIDEPSIFHQALLFALQPYMKSKVALREELRLVQVDGVLHHWEGEAPDRTVEQGWQPPPGTSDKDVEPLG